jgi:hypothetical protein
MIAGALADIQAKFLLNSSHGIIYSELKPGRGTFECNDPALVKIGG